MNSPGFPAIFLYLIESAKIDTNSAQRFALCQARMYILLKLLLEVKAQLVIQFRFYCLLAEEGAGTENQIAEHK